MRKGTNHRIITADTPLSKTEKEFVAAYVSSKSASEAVRKMVAAGQLECALTTNALKKKASRFLALPNVMAEIDKCHQQIIDRSIADGVEVMQYFTAVMRGEIKDQFELDAPLMERTKAAIELARRTIDLENRRNGEADQSIRISLDWSRRM